jgi:hypothetical protein
MLDSCMAIKLLNKLLMKVKEDVGVGGPKRKASIILKGLRTGHQRIILPCWTLAWLVLVWRIFLYIVLMERVNKNTMKVPVISVHPKPKFIILFAEKTFQQNFWYRIIYVSQFLKQILIYLSNHGVIIKQSAINPKITEDTIVLIDVIISGVDILIIRY